MCPLSAQLPNKLDYVKKRISMYCNVWVTKKHFFKKIFLIFFKSWVSFSVCFSPLSICSLKQHPKSFERFGWIQADNIVLCIHTRIHSCINEVVCFGLWAVPSTLHTLRFPPTSWSFSQLSIGYCSRTICLFVCFSKLYTGLPVWGLLMVYSL